MLDQPLRLISVRRVGVDVSDEEKEGPVLRTLPEEPNRFVGQQMGLVAVPNDGPPLVGKLLLPKVGGTERSGS
ncbi:MAG: hypothetical protein KatS3mg115_1593 [Candidatus Poribacteria bacterium]|nr:MAG: hypothetical protein KatS3mg115_1593 [Candidatus Poribacteria bacterium]